MYECQSCGYISPKWAGKCPDCGAWNSLVEETREALPKAIQKVSAGTKPVPLSSLELSGEERISTGSIELNRVTGGGIVAGSLILIGGDPGVGKSTLMLQLLDGIYKHANNQLPAALYVSGEESLKQIKIRSLRLHINTPLIVVLSETCVEIIIEHAKKLQPSILIVDSIQTVYTQTLPSAPGSIGQVRESATKLMHFAKRTNTPVFLVGHVTKEGAIAGPRVLEHIVDTVLYFEGERMHHYRILRAVKNRFGSTNEIGVFTMEDSGLKEITNPSELFLSERPEGKVSGTTVVSTIEGTRPLMVELQALVCQTTFGVPRRTSIGVDINRVNLLVAVLEKIAGLNLGYMDIFTNVVGGLKIVEPAFDLGIIATIASSFKNVPIKKNTFVFGEVGLSGEVRTVSQAEARLREGEKIGFKEAVIPATNYNKLTIKPNINVIGVKNIDETIKAVLDY